MIIRKFLKIILLFVPIFGMFLASSCGSSKIIFANFESYMSDLVKTNLNKKYEITFLPYQSNEEIENKFKNYYDIAVPSTYEVINLKKNNLLEKINWELFNIKKEDGSIIKTSKEVLESNIFTNSINIIINKIDNKYFPHGNESILDYGIPYFLQSFSFAYKGSSIEKLEVANTWKNVLSVINSYQDDLDERFSFDKERKIGIIDDSRSMFGLSNLIINTDDGVNPSKDLISIEDFLKIYSNFSENFKKDYTIFNSDSGQIISSLAKPFPGGLSSAIAYNGDILYSAMGGGLYEPPLADNFHYCNLDETLLALDMVVINNKNVNNSIKKTKIYNAVKDVCLSGTSFGEDIKQKENEDYLYDSMNNFDYVLYTSPIQKIYEYVMGDEYFEGTTEQTNMYKKIFDILVDNNFNVKYLEDAITNELAKSNMHWAYLSMKNKL